MLTTAGTLNGTSNYDIANYGTLAGTFTGYTAPSGYTLNYSGSNFSAHDIELDATAVLEPSTLAGVAAAILGMWVALRRRRKVA